MAYTNVWSDSTPTGAEAANTIDDIFRSTKLDIDERIVDIFAMPSMATDPLRPYGIKFTDAQDAILSLGDNGGTPRSIIVKDKAGANTYLTLNSITFNPSIPINVTSAGGLAIGTVSGRRRLVSTSSTAFQLLSDADASADLAIANLNLNAAGIITFSAQSKLSSPADGLLLVTNNAVTGFNRLQLGGTTASFPAIARNSTTVKFRLADDSADAPITAALGTFSNGITITAGASSFAAAVTMLAGLTVTGAITGTLTGNASTATALQTGRAINGVTFDGTANITIPSTDYLAATITTDSGAVTTTYSDVMLLGILTSGIWEIRGTLYSQSSNGAGVQRLYAQLVAGTPGNVTAKRVGYIQIVGSSISYQSKAQFEAPNITDGNTHTGAFTPVVWVVSLSGSTTITLQIKNESGAETQTLLALSSLIAHKVG